MDAVGNCGGDCGAGGKGRARGLLPSAPRHIDHNQAGQGEYCPSSVVIPLALVRAEMNAVIRDRHKGVAINAEAGSFAGFVGLLDSSKHRSLIRFEVSGFQSRKDRPMQGLPSLPFAMSGVPIHSCALSPDNPQLANRNSLLGNNPTAPQKRSKDETRSTVNGELCTLVYVIPQAPNRSQFQQPQASTNNLSDGSPLATFSPTESAA